MEISFLPGEDGMRGNLNFQVKVAGRAASGARFPFPPEAQAGAAVHPRRNAHLELLLFLHRAAAPAVDAGGGDEGASPETIRTIVEDLQKSPGLANLPPAPTARAALTLGAGFQAAAAAAPATDSSFHLQAGIQASHHFFQGQDHPLAQIRPGLGPFGLGRPFPEAEKFLEYVPKGAKDILKTAEAADIHTGQARMAIQVV